MTTYDELAQRYIDTWNETDPSARRAAVDQLYAEDARYVDPLAAAEGREAIAAMIGAVQDQFPGFVFRLAGPVDGHHNQARFGWELGPDGTDAPIVGFDVTVIDGDGRIQTVLGFLDKVPAAA
jgi:SnoaL-like domain